MQHGGKGEVKKTALRWIKPSSGPLEAHTINHLTNVAIQHVLKELLASRDVRSYLALLKHIFL